MKVLVITGSPHKTGTSSVLADRFISGAQQAGHEVIRFDAAFKDIHPCIACEKCHTTAEGCVFKDAMKELNPHLISADAIVFVSPIYYYGISAQLKAVIDRFYANDSILHEGKKAALMVTMADDTIESAQGAIISFNNMVKFLEWENAGMVIAVNCHDTEAMSKTDYPNEAYELGKNI